MKRRDFVASVLVGGLATPLVGHESDKDQDQDQGHAHDNVDGELANATVSFGNWRTDPPINRFDAATANPRTQNGHQLIPHIARIKVGGTVNFIIGGFHHVLVYGPGTQPTDINVDAVVPGSAPPLIDDPNNRVYRGLDPRLQGQDRVEVVSFQNPGVYLAICGVRPHFVNDNMFGYVQVVASDNG